MHACERYVSRDRHAEQDLDRNLSSMVVRPGEPCCEHGSGALCFHGPIFPQTDLSVGVLTELDQEGATGSVWLRRRLPRSIFYYDL